MTGAAIDQPVRKDLAEAAKRAGDQVAPLRFDFELRRDRLASPGHKCFRERYDDFADVFPGSHQSKGGIDVVSRESSERQRTQSTFLNKPGNLREHVSGERLVTRKHSVHRDNVE